MIASGTTPPQNQGGIQTMMLSGDLNLIESSA